MSLLHPSVSDIWDRIVILQLKIEHAARAGKPVVHFAREYEELCCELPNRPQVPGILEYVEDLKKLHAAIWDGIAVLTARPVVTKENAMQLAATAVNLQSWNLQRVKVKERIDRETGEYKGEEKV